MILLITAIIYYCINWSKPQPYATLDIIITACKRNIRMNVHKIDCHPGTLRQQAWRGISDLKLRGSTFKMYMVMKWHGRLISHVNCSTIISPPSQVKLTLWQSFILSRIFWSSYDVSTELIYHDTNGRKTVRAGSFDRPRSVFVRYSRCERLQQEYEYRQADDHELTSFLWYDECMFSFHDLLCFSQANTHMYETLTTRFKNVNDDSKGDYIFELAAQFWTCVKWGCAQNIK